MRLFSEKHIIHKIFILCTFQLSIFCHDGFIIEEILPENPIEIPETKENELKVSSETLNQMLTQVAGVGLFVDQDVFFHALQSILKGDEKETKLSLIENEDDVLRHILKLNDLKSLKIFLESKSNLGSSFSQSYRKYLSRVHFGFYSSLLEILLESQNEEMINFFVPFYCTEVYERILRSQAPTLDFINWLHYLAHLKTRYPILDYKRLFYFRDERNFSHLASLPIQIMMREKLKKEEKPKEELPF